MIEREYKKLQEKHRETLTNEYKLQTDKEHLEASVRVIQDDYQKVNSEFEESLFRWKKERSDLIQKINEF
jgi:antirestriction protein